jgi:hypothetical protein
MYYRTREELPDTGQLCLCKCPNWCRSGFQVAEWDGVKFDFDESPNDMFDGDVIEWMPLNEYGEPEVDDVDFDDEDDDY